MKKILIIILVQISVYNYAQVIADHTVVDLYDQIPQQWIDSVKTMWVSFPGESHSEAYRAGCELLEAIDSRFQVNVTESGTPESYTDQHLRISRATRGDLNISTNYWIYDYGEEDWFSSPTAIEHTKAGLQWCQDNNFDIAAMGFAWCWDASWQNEPSGSYDPVYHTRWAGSTQGGTDGNTIWGLDSEDSILTGNRVCVDTYLDATQQYIDYCETNHIDTKIIWTTGPVDNEAWTATGEVGYQQCLKYEHIRNHVETLDDYYFLDFADILSYNDAGVQTTTSWTDNSGTLRTFPKISPENMEVYDDYHFGSAGAIKIAKATWYLLARMAGWDGVVTGATDFFLNKDHSFLYNIGENEINIKLQKENKFQKVKLYNTTGRVLQEQQININSCIIRIADLPVGVYLVSLENYKEIETFKVVIR